MCNCIETWEKKFEKKTRAVKTIIKNTMFVFPENSAALEQRLANVVQVTYSNGKVIENNVVFSFCGICGDPYDEREIVESYSSYFLITLDRCKSYLLDELTMVDDSVRQSIDRRYFSKSYSIERKIIKSQENNQLKYSIFYAVRPKKKISVADRNKRFMAN